MPVSVLIITDTWDSTTDIVVGRLGSKCFRVNTDIIKDYTIHWEPNGFSIQNAAGGSLKSCDVTSVYWRKPFTSDLYDSKNDEHHYFYSECRYLIREMYNFCRMAGAHCLIEEGAERRLGKFIQITIAKKHFKVAGWECFLGVEFPVQKQTIVKSLSAEQLTEDSVLYTSDVTGLVLSKDYLWFTQDFVMKDADVTVCYVRGDLFAFELIYTAGNSVDLRADQARLNENAWRPTNLDTRCSSSIKDFMVECRLHFGRLDFVRRGSDLVFLEVNPNGQWAWLDLHDKTGLITRVIEAVQGH